MKLFKLFDSQREGKGVSKEDAVMSSDLKGFFKAFKLHFSKLVSVNIIYVLGNFPIIFFILALSGRFNIASTAPGSILFPALHGIMLHDSSPLMLSLFGVFGLQTELSAFGTVSYILFGLTGLLLFTFGPVNAGTAYILRNLLRGDPVFIWSDFWYAVKRNIKQSLIFGFFDLLIMAIFTYDIIAFYANMGSFIYSLMFYTCLVCAVLYFFMRFYIYIMMVTFDLSLLKLLKNGLIFSILGFKRNILALLGIIAAFALNYFVLMFFLPLGISLPFIITFAVCAYIATFAAYYKIKEIMIDPYYEENPPDEETE